MKMHRLSQTLFGLFLFLLLASHAPTHGGPFAWLPLPLPTAVTGQGWQIGVLALLPVVVIVSWWTGKIYPQITQISQMIQIEKKSSDKWFGLAHHKPAESLIKTAWSWGETAVTIPLAAFSLLVLVQLAAETAHVAAMMGLCWFVYLFLVNHPAWHRDGLWRVLVAVLLVQGSVAVVQFFVQKEAGLSWLGEPTLDLLVEGTSVAQRDGQNWLRAYGLNSHPNQLGLLLMVLCLRLWPNRHEVRGWWRWLFWLGLAAGVAGLLVSLSRTAGLGLLLGGLVFGLHRRSPTVPLRREYALPLALLVAGVLLFALAYGDVMAGRLLSLDSPLESRSLWERQRDLALSWQMLGERPFLGVGLGQYLPMAAQLNPEAGLVHNVPLLIGAEQGLLGLSIWLIFWLWPLWRHGRQAHCASAAAVWLALIVMAMLHPEPALTLPKGAALWGLASAQWHSFPRSQPWN